MSSKPMRRLRSPATLLAAAVAFALVGAAGTLQARSAGSSGKGEAGQGESRGGPPVEVREGFVVNFVHRYYFPVGRWKLTGTPEEDFQELQHASLPGVILRVLVSPGSARPLDGEMKALRAKAAEDPHVHILMESRERQAGVLLAVREGKGSEPLAVLRTICFNRGKDKYYLRLEAPADSYEKASRDFDAVFEDLKFEFRFKLPWKK